MTLVQDTHSLPVTIKETIDAFTTRSTVDWSCSAIIGTPRMIRSIFLLKQPWCNKMCDEEHDKVHHHDSTLVDEIGWQVTWTKAFPTLLAFDVYCDEESAKFLRVLAFHEIIHQEQQQATATRQQFHIESINWSDSLGYGEITCEAVFQVISWLQQWQPKFSPTHVVDLGSGNGKVLLANSIAFPFKHLLGMEILHHLHHQAKDHWKRWKERFVLPTLTNIQDQCIEFQRADFTLDPSKIHNADLIWIHATVFEPKLLQTIQNICEGCKTGTYFILVSQPFKNGNGIQTLAEFLLDMNWGQASVCIQQKQ